MAFLLIFTALIVIGLSYYLAVWTYWKRRGIPGPIGFPILGNVLEMIDHDAPPFLQFQKWSQKYGSYFGITEGLSKTLVISDPEMVNEVFVKQFDNFYGRKLNGIQGDPNKDKRVHLFASEGHRWKRLRNLSSPSFSNNSLKKLKRTVEDSAVELLKHIENNTANGDSIDMLLYYQEFTMDVIGRIAMGQNESKMFNDNILLEPVKSIFGSGRRWLMILGQVLPKPAAYIMRKIIFSLPKSIPAVQLHRIIEEALEKRIAQRKNDQENGVEPGEPEDFIDLFLNAESEIDIVSENGKDDFLTKNSGKVSKNLTIDEIVGQCFVFLLAGFDTTALSLSYSSYLLARHPEVMRKVQKEIEEVCPDPEITFDQLSKLKYLDSVIKETLRIYPLGAVANMRRCMKTSKVGDLIIEKGTNVYADTWSLHYNKTLWGEDAAEFRPERWEEEGITDFKLGYMPFGSGPRQCIGMRLAYMEEKLLLSQILRKYDFVTCEKTAIPLKLVGRATTGPEEVYLNLKPRYT
ncbi:unnamed protein product [Caenorhabditis angaria]|uniref:Cytochrome P450 n=1 Tax=Caenorhabditis angaria TaxID=860376 RepID=A0A9P1ITI9_9PELO|nr:unnamed protein product [Caenorhabditis angaria]